MNDLEVNRTPAAFDAILNETNALGFNMVSEPRVGALLAVLAASKPGGRLLELGTGTGHGHVVAAIRHGFAISPG